MKRFLILLLLLIFVLPLTAAAQDGDTPTGWPIIERCLSPTLRPDGWGFEGTILLEGYAGIHGVNDAWPTPHVLLFLGDNNLPGGALSPDDRWYAAPWGTITMDEQSYNVITVVKEVRVYSLADAELYHYTISNLVIFYQGTYLPVHWKDNEQVVFIDNLFFAWNFLTGEIFPIEGNRDDIDTYMASPGDIRPRARPSPDWTLVVRPGWQLYKIPSGTQVSGLPLTKFSVIAWTPDSSLFTAETDTPFSRQLVFFDRTGSITETVFDIPEGQWIGPRSAAWSSNSRYFAFATYEDRNPSFYVNYSSPNTLYIADTKEHIVFDTCMSIGNGEAWSPDNTQLAILEPGEGVKYVMIVDLKSWTLYPVANHAVQGWEGVIGWRAD